MQIKTTLMVVGLSSTLSLLAGCNPKSTDQPNTQNNSQVSTTDTENTQGIRSFAATAKDTHDIAVLDDYHDKFNTMSIEFDKDLARLKQDGYLNSTMEVERRRDQALSALNMLKALPLETEQGRYIQGLLYQYWEQQYQHYTASTASSAQPNVPVEQTNTELTLANAQLQSWKAAQSSPNK